jgi:sugar/nucleoside kinase (ribokinase family)
MPDVDILMVGNFAKDKLIVDGVEEVASGGGVYYGSVVIQRLGMRAGVVTRLHPDDFGRLDEIRVEGVQVHAAASEGTSGIANYYRSDDMERRICKPIGFGGAYSLADIPDISADLIMLTPLFAGEVDLPLLQALAERAPVALDIQGFVRVPVEDGLEFQPWPQLEAGLKAVTYLKVDLAEAEYLTGCSDYREACQKLVEMGPKEIVLTQSSGVTVYANGRFHQAPFFPRSLVGRTGRGDTCFSTYLAVRLSEPAAIACEWAAIVTTLKQEQPGPWKGSVEDVLSILEGG